MIMRWSCCVIFKNWPWFVVSICCRFPGIYLIFLVISDLTVKFDLFILVTWSSNFCMLIVNLSCNVWNSAVFSNSLICSCSPRISVLTVVTIVSSCCIISFISLIEHSVKMAFQVIINGSGWGAVGALLILSPLGIIALSTYDFNVAASHHTHIFFSLKLFKFPHELF